MGIASSSAKAQKANIDEVITGRDPPSEPEVLPVERTSTDDQGFVLVTAAASAPLKKESMLDAARRGATVPESVASEHVRRKRQERKERHRAALAEARAAAAEATVTDAEIENSNDDAIFLSENDAKVRQQKRRYFSEKERLGIISRTLEHHAPSTVGVLQDLSQPAEDSNTSSGHSYTAGGCTEGQIRNKRQLRAWRLRNERATAAAAAKAKEQRLEQFRQAKLAQANAKSSAACASFKDSRYHRISEKHLKRGGAVAFSAVADISLHGRPASFGGIGGRGMVPVSVC